MTTIAITGASTGLGRATAEALIREGHEVVVHARAAERLAGDELLERAAGAVYGDLGDPDQVAGLAEELSAFGRFDAVIHNAGVLNGTDVFAVNLVAPYLLTALMPLPQRMIVLSSSMHFTGSADLTDLDLRRPGARRHAYDDSKLYLTTLAMALAERHPQLLAHAVDPGWVPTRMGGASAPDDLEEGHRTQTWLATAPDSEIRPASGGYWHHRRARRPHSVATDPAFQAELLRMLALQTGVDLPQ